MAAVTDPRPEVRWLDEPEDHDYPNAAAYLRLLAGRGLVDDLVDRLRDADTVHQAAKDVLRASGLPVLPPDEPGVASDLRKIAAGTRLSPVLLVRGDLRAGLPLTIADGYHRICAAFLVDEDTAVPCRLVSAPDDAGR
jgi:hypothetical protein